MSARGTIPAVGAGRCPRVAHERGTGARGLRAVVEHVVEGVLFEASEAERGQVFVIDERAVRGEAPPQRKPVRAVPPLRALIRRRATAMLRR